ncbi:MAG: thiolase family protein [Bdellovibrionota bacterium]
MSKEVVIVSAARTPIGSFLGALSAIPAPRLGAIAIKSALERAKLDPKKVDQVIMGNVLSAGSGQAPGRQAMIYAGIPHSVPATTINKVCGSGMQAVNLARNAILAGESECIVAGGMENMSLAPYLMEEARTGFRMGEKKLKDSMVSDGLWDPYNNFHMGNAAEICVRENHFTREQQDAFAISSYKKAQAAITGGAFKNEITPVTLESKKGPITVDKDEEAFNTNFDKIPSLRPAFEKEGTITAANASKINDGAAAVVLMTESTAKARGLKPLAKIVAQATFAQDPKYFTTAPVGAIKKALQNANLKIADIDLWEINEAFAVVAQVAMKELEIPAEKVNVHGGAIALGHPLGASGARIFTTLAHALHTHNKRYGLATLCIGGGEAVAVIIEKI